MYEYNFISVCFLKCVHISFYNADRTYHNYFLYRYYVLYIYNFYYLTAWVHSSKGFKPFKAITGIGRVVWPIGHTSRTVRAHSTLEGFWPF